MSADGRQEDVETENETAENPVVNEAAAEESSSLEADAEQDEEEAEEEEQEDPELVALKEEIAQLESSLKEKRRQVANTNDRAEDFSKAGYARKVAEMENMRRARSMLNSSNRSSSMAATLARFLPILDRLYDTKSQYGDDEFGKQYNALPGSLQAALSKLGVTDYTVSVGEKIDAERMVVVESEHSEAHPANTVLRPVRMGMELQGNVIRPAECVASLGPEVKEEEAAAEAAAVAAAAEEEGTDADPDEPTPEEESSSSGEDAE